LFSAFAAVKEIRTSWMGVVAVAVLGLAGTISCVILGAVDGEVDVVVVVLVVVAVLMVDAGDGFWKQQSHVPVVTGVDFLLRRPRKSRE